MRVPGRSQASTVENNLSKGLITEATGLNFPVDAATDADNVVFNPVGSVTRRKGIDLEDSAITKAYQDSDGLINEFLWQAVAQTGGFTFLVMQIGVNIHFFQMSTDNSLSQHIAPVSLNLEDYRAPQASEILNLPASFASGAGNLYIAHPSCEPIIVKWNSDTNKFEAAKILILIRDFKGIDDGLAVDNNPPNLSDKHHYNLLNQGWDQMVRVGSVSNELGDGGTISNYTPPGITFTELS